MTDQQLVATGTREPRTAAGRALDQALASVTKMLPPGSADQYRDIILFIEDEAATPPADSPGLREAAGRIDALYDAAPDDPPRPQWYYDGWYAAMDAVAVALRALEG